MNRAMARTLPVEERLIDWAVRGTVLFPQPAESVETLPRLGNHLLARLKTRERSQPVHCPPTYLPPG